LHRKAACAIAVSVCVAIAAAAFTVCPAPAARAAAAAGQVDAYDTAGSGGLTIDVADVPLKSVIQLLVRESGVNIIMAGSDKMDTPITATLRNLPLETILESIVTTAGVRYVRRPDGTYLIGSDVDLSAAVQPAQASKMEVPATPAPQPVAEPTPAPAPRKRTEVIKLQNISPKDAMAAIGAITASDAFDDNPAPQSWVRPGKFLRVDRNFMGPQADLIEYDPRDPVIHRSNQPVINVYPAAPTTDSPNPGVANRSSEPGASVNQYVPPRSTTTRPTQAPGQPGTTGTGTTATGDSTALLGESIDAIFAYPEQNALLVRGEDEDIEDLKNLISLIDIPPRQVVIKAEFVEVSTSVTQRMGIDWLLSRPNYVVQTNFTPGGNVLVGVQTGNLTATLRAELTQGGGKVVNAPIISTLNNRRAYITVSQGDWVFSPVIETTQTGNITRSIPQPIQFDSSLEVLPQINGDNSITLTLRPQISDQSGISRSPDGQELPKTTTQFLSTARRVQNGETIVVGGFIKKNDNKSGTKVPILGDLPLIGSLFRTGFDIKQDTETLIFITPTIVEERTAGTAIGVVSP